MRQRVSGVLTSGGATAYLVLARWLFFDVVHDVQETNNITKACYVASRSKSASSTVVLESPLRSSVIRVYKHRKCIPVTRPSVVSRRLGTPPRLLKPRLSAVDFIFVHQPLPQCSVLLPPCSGQQPLMERNIDVTYVAVLTAAVTPS
jgi:hypothetical protein